MINGTRRISSLLHPRLYHIPDQHRDNDILADEPLNFPSCHSLSAKAEFVFLNRPGENISKGLEMSDVILFLRFVGLMLGAAAGFASAVLSAVLTFG